jgi:hypothetical protein
MCVGGGGGAVKAVRGAGLSNCRLPAASEF